MQSKQINVGGDIDSGDKTNVSDVTVRGDFTGARIVDDVSGQVTKIIQ
ncbi:MAG: hypothetical protein AB1861_19285 [Cyanobacteriota bacterium]